MKIDHSGMALLVVLAVISVLLAGALELARTTGRSAQVTGHCADRFLAREQAMAGIHLALAILEKDAVESDIDSVQEDWARPDKLALAVQKLGYESGGPSLEITDELGKLQVNALMARYPGHMVNPDQSRVWGRLFEFLEQDPVPLLNCLKDWLDSRDDDQVTGISGAESDAYLSLDPPYLCANGPFYHVSEIFLVNGISPELFEQEDGEITPGEIITVHGVDVGGKTPGRYVFPGRVNINTASVPVIRALLPELAADWAEELVAYRSKKSENGENFSNILDKGWVNQVIDLPKEERAVFDRCVRYDSDLFRAISKAGVHQAKIIISAVIRREKDHLSGQWSCRIIQMEEEK